MVRQHLFPLPNGLALRIRTDDTEAAALLFRVERRGRVDRTLLFERYGATMRQGYAEKFREGGDPRWQELRPNTVAAKRRLLQAGLIPARGKGGRIPRRLKQFDPRVGVHLFSPHTILIETGALRDSYANKSAKGNVTRVSVDRGFYGSQYTLTRLLTPNQELKPYLKVSKKALAGRRRGRTVSVEVPLALIHEVGAPGANIPARPVANVRELDVTRLREQTTQWFWEGVR